MNTKKITGSRFIAETLEGYGVSHVFFVPTILTRTLVEMEKLGIKRVLAHTEKSAAYMADGYARAARKPGVCMAQSVGAANMAAGLQDAYLGLSPVVAITGRKDHLNQHRNAYQEVDHLPFFEAVTKYNVIVAVPEQLPYLLRQAFRSATSGAPGPVHLDLIDHQGAIIEKAQIEAEVIVEESFTKVPSTRIYPDPDRLQEILGAIAQAQKPVIVAGGGAATSGAGSDIVKLAERLAIPVATSLNGKGIIPDNHPLALGVVGSYSRPCANQIVSESDLTIFVGSHTGDQVTNHWTVPKPGSKVIQIDIDPAETGRNYPNASFLVADAQAAVTCLLQGLGDLKPKQEWAEYARNTVKAWRKKAEAGLDGSTLRPERLCQELSKALPQDAIVVADTGLSSIWPARMLDFYSPQQRFLRAAGSLGWGFPASLGAKCGAPGNPVVCFIGDGGFWYHIGEIETAVRQGINTVTVVNNNNRLGQCRPSVENAYGGLEGEKEGIYCFSPVSFAKLAEVMGAWGLRIDRAEDLQGGLKEALNAGRPAVLEVMTDPIVGTEVAVINRS